MTTEQTIAIKCAHADLVGSLQTHRQSDPHAHNWESHLHSIHELEDAFPDQLSDCLFVDEDEDEE